MPKIQDYKVQQPPTSGELRTEALDAHAQRSLLEGLVVIQECDTLQPHTLEPIRIHQVFHLGNGALAFTAGNEALPSVFAVTGSDPTQPAKVRMITE